MARSIAAFALGFIVMFLAAGVSFAVAVNALGDDHLFQPGSFEPSPLWAALRIGLLLIAAIAGGFAAAGIARSPQPLRALAVFVFALGALAAVPSMRYDRTQMPPRLGQPSDRQAGLQVPPPHWIALLNPVLAAGGIVAGGALRGRRVIGRTSARQG